jgi:hypothetical protein
VSEDRYVVRDAEGDAWDGVTWIGDDEIEPMTRADALQAAANGEKSRPEEGPFKLYRIKAKPQPTAPRSIFVIQNEYGELVDDFSGCMFESPEEARKNCEPEDRIVRYVLAGDQ